MTSNPISGLIPRGSLGLKLLLVCLLVLAMGAPLLIVGGLVSERQGRAAQVTAEIGAASGGPQSVGGPMLLVPYQRSVETTDDQGRTQRRIDRGTYVIFAETGAADASLRVEERKLGIYRAATYRSETAFTAAFDPAATLAGMDESFRFDWPQARIVMFVSDSRAIRNAPELRFATGATALMEPISDLSLAAPVQDYARPGVFSRPSAPLPSQLVAFAAPAGFGERPAPFSVETRLDLSGAQRFAIAAFAQDTSATIRGDRRDARAEGYFQSDEALQNSGEGFVVSWRTPLVGRGIEKAADLASFNLGQAAAKKLQGRQIDGDMAVSFVSSDDVYQGVARAVRYGIMFIGIVFLAVLIFEAASGRKAHPAQYLLVGLAQCVFYLLLLSLTELIGFAAAFVIAAAATVGLLAYYAGASFGSRQVGLKALGGLAVLYGAMYVLMTLEDFALLAGSLVAFAVIAATMIATRRIDWYGRSASGSQRSE
ncbi:MAG TPA: cell envelope integrity protein CreD [Terricaulis sp.]|nr:cell envelope integrity protein CreD [Terricaulis sp.]